MAHIEIFFATISAPPAFASKLRNTSPVDIDTSITNAIGPPGANAPVKKQASDRYAITASASIKTAPNKITLPELSAARPSIDGARGTTRPDVSSY
jgi:hypothetical protein